VSHRKTKLSLCLVTCGEDSALWSVLLPRYQSALEEVGGDLVLAGDLRGVNPAVGATCIHLPEEARAGRIGKLRNAAISRSRGDLILTGNGCGMFDPEKWASQLLDWASPIDASVRYIFGFGVLSSSGERLWDWVNVDAGNRVTLQEYGEQASSIALGGGYLGMSRAAWDSSGGFSEDFQGPGEEVEFSHRQSKGRRAAIVFCDAFRVLRQMTRANQS
jgi:hypothetical protein